MIEEGAEINVKDDKNKTPLHWAALEGSIEVTKVLFENNAQVDAVDTSGNTALHYACRYYPPVAKYLTEGGAEVNLKNNDGETPLHLAAKTNHVEAIEVLLIRDADVNAVDKCGNTALQLAIQYSHSGVAAALVRGGAKADTKYAKDRRALDLAAMKGNEEFTEEILKHQAPFSGITSGNITQGNMNCKCIAFNLL